MMNKAKSMLFIMLFLILVTHLSRASVFILPPTGDVIGEVRYAYSHIGETIDEVGRRYNVGYYEMVRANPQADAVYALPAHTKLIIPSQYILPDVPKRGIVINLAEYRLYYFAEDENIVLSFPIGIGKVGWNTPLGITKVTAKVHNPIWRPTARVRMAAEEIGATLPDECPAGSDNPLGRHALRLGWPTILIHGTNRLDGVGARVSAGCIRMLPDDIEHLFELVSVGTPVRVINEPVKVGKQNGSIYMQIHPVLKEDKQKDLSFLIQKKLKSISFNPNLNQNKEISVELVKPTGMVKKIS